MLGGNAMLPVIRLTQKPTDFLDPKSNKQETQIKLHSKALHRRDVLFSYYDHVLLSRQLQCIDITKVYTLHTISLYCINSIRGSVNYTSYTERRRYCHYPPPTLVPSYGTPILSAPVTLCLLVLIFSDGKR